MPNARNARTHSQEQILQLRASLREFGFVNPVIVDKDLNIIAGHGRVLAAKAEGVSEVPCVFVEHLTAAQKRAYILADNKLALNAGWDEELLTLEFGELKDLGFDLELTGFGPDEIDKLFASDTGEVQDDDFDLTAALEQASFVLPGDVWTLGRHRLICGDATDADTVKKLMDGRQANLVLTDPPYNVSFESSSGLKIKNDSQSAEQFYSFLLSAFLRLLREPRRWRRVLLLPLGLREGELLPRLCGRRVPLLHHLCLGEERAGAWARRLPTDA